VPLDAALAELVAVDEERHVAALAQATTVVGGLQAHLVVAGRERVAGVHVELL
jgi:hypothetical protein